MFTGEAKLTSTEFLAFSQGLDKRKKFTESGVEYWRARSIMLLLGYYKWRNFEFVVHKAMEACQRTKVNPANHFADIGNMVKIGSGAYRAKADFFLSRHACYLIALSADSAKPEVGFAKLYFAIQTRRQELEDQQRRLELRLQIIDSDYQLEGAARKAGVQRHSLFQDAGYRGLYAMAMSNLKTRKGLKPKQELLDYAGELELAINQLRIVLTRHRLYLHQIRSENDAIQTHKKVGEAVRETVVRDNGIAPENLPLESSIKPLMEKHRQLGTKQTKTVSASH